MRQVHLIHVWDEFEHLTRAGGATAMNKQPKIPILVELSCQQGRPGHSTSVKHRMLGSAKRGKESGERETGRLWGRDCCLRLGDQGDLTEVTLD